VLPYDEAHGLRHGIEDNLRTFTHNLVEIGALAA
jgi:hypothetical protein